jgi:hypothetical protein
VAGRAQEVGDTSTHAPVSATTLRGRWLLLARAAWVVIAALTLGVFVASISGYVSSVFELGRADWMGAPVEAPAALVFALDLVGLLASVTAALLCLTLGVVLFWRRSDDWMVVFVSSYLLAYGSVFAGLLEWAEAFYPWWPSLAIEVVQPLLLTVPTVALVVLFPDGRLVARWTRWLGLAAVLLVIAILFLPPAYWNALWPFILLGALSAQIYRYRRVSTPTERQQTKWVVFGILSWLMLMAVLFVPYSIEISLPSGSTLPW